MIERQPAFAGQFERAANHRPFTRKRSGSKNAPRAGDELRDPRAAHAEQRHAVFGRPHAADARVELMLIGAPVGHVHRGRDDGLRPLANQFVGDAPVAQVVADAQADLAPGRIPKPLLRCRQSVPEELNGHAFGLTKNDFAARPCQRYDTNYGKCLPGDPVPYLLYPTELSLTGGLTEAGVIVALFYLIP